jgi:hypothetical protein
VIEPALIVVPTTGEVGRHPRADSAVGEHPHADRGARRASGCCFQHYLVTDFQDSLTRLPPIFPHCGTGREAAEGSVLDPEATLVLGAVMAGF